VLESSNVIHHLVKLAPVNILHSGDPIELLSVAFRRIERLDKLAMEVEVVFVS
jgi:hypothetical protein